jgi:hypothetical protein
MLSKLEWKILEGISYDVSEPLEVVDELVMNFVESSDPLETLMIIYELYKKEFVKVYQQPITAFAQNQDFERKELKPTKPIEVVGDLWNVFQNYSIKRDYLEKIGDTGVPFGIYIAITEKGQKEIERKEYTCFEDD